MVAQQILSILSALAAGSQRFVFEGREIKLEWSCGIFITMNPGEHVVLLFQVFASSMPKLLNIRVISNEYS